MYRALRRPLHPCPAGGSKGKPRGIMGKHGVMKYFTTPLSGASAASGLAASDLCGA